METDQQVRLISQPMKTVRGLSISFVGLLAFEINELSSLVQDEETLEKWQYPGPFKEYQGHCGVSSVEEHVVFK